MRRIMATCTMAPPEAVVRPSPFESRRRLPGQPNVRSTARRPGDDSRPLDLRRIAPIRKSAFAATRFRKFAGVTAARPDQPQPARRGGRLRHDPFPAVAVPHVRPAGHGRRQRARRVCEGVPLAALHIFSPRRSRSRRPDRPSSRLGRRSTRRRVSGGAGRRVRPPGRAARAVAAGRRRGPRSRRVGPSRPRTHGPQAACPSLLTHPLRGWVRPLLRKSRTGVFGPVLICGCSTTPTSRNGTHTMSGPVDPPAAQLRLNGAGSI